MSNVNQSENFKRSTLYMARGGPSINTSQENRPIRRRVGSNVESIVRPDSRQSSTAPIQQSHGDASSRNGGKQGPSFDEDCSNIHSPRQKTSRGNVKLLRISNRNVDKELTDNQVFQLPGEMMSQEGNYQQQPRLLRKQERGKNKNKKNANKQERKSTKPPL